MKKHFILFDWLNYAFFDLPKSNDILKAVNTYIEKTGAQLQDLRLFEFETREQWEAMHNEWRTRTGNDLSTLFE